MGADRRERYEMVKDTRTAAERVAAAQEEGPNRDSAIGTADTGPGHTVKAPTERTETPDEAQRAAPDLSKLHELRALRGESLHELRAEQNREAGGPVMSTVDRMSEYGGQVLGNITAERAQREVQASAPTHGAPRTFGAIGKFDPQSDVDRPDGTLTAAPFAADATAAWDPNHEQGAKR